MATGLDGRGLAGLRSLALEFAIGNGGGDARLVEQEEDIDTGGFAGFGVVAALLVALAAIDDVGRRSRRAGESKAEKKGGK